MRFIYKTFIKNSFLKKILRCIMAGFLSGKYFDQAIHVSLSNFQKYWYFSVLDKENCANAQ